MSLLDLLANDLLAWMKAAPDGVPRRVLLWLDPEAQFARLAGHLEPALAGCGAKLLRLDPEAGFGQLALKLELLRLEAAGDGRAVVYLPGFGRPALGPRLDGAAPDLWGVYEYRFKGCVWGLGERWEAGAVPEPPTLLAWLGRHGLVVSDGRTAKALAAGGRDSLLARYAERQRQTQPTDWPRPLRLDDVRDALGGDPRDALRRLLAAPNNEVRRWGDEAALTLQRIAGEYGLAVPPGGISPEELADSLVVQLALAEAWDAFGRPADFPYLSRLPARLEHRQRLARFLREDVVSHTELGPRFYRRMRRLESTYNLAAWAAGRAGQPAGLPGLARARWRQFLQRFDAAAAGGWKVARDLVLAEREAIAEAAAGPWERLGAVGAGSAGGETHWSVLADLAALAAGVATAVEELASLKTPASLVEAYTARWWRLDWLQLRVRAACSRAPGLEQVRRVADLVYFDFASKAGDRFAALVEAEGKWPPAGTAAVESPRQRLWGSAKGRRAVIVCDACRWDFAEVLKERLGTDGCTLAPTLATLPTDTEFGMAAMLPLGDEPVSVEFGAGPGKPTIRQGEGPNLATRDGRKEYLKAKLVKSAKLSVEFVDLEALLKGAKVPGTPLVVVFDNNIDEQGHKGAEELPALAEQFVGNLKRAVELLHAAGIGTVHVVTDHGFLLLPAEEVDALGAPQVLPDQALYKDVRWAALKPDAPVTEVIRLPLPLAPKDVLLGLPRGVRTLVKAPAYLHGGLCLQECVIPHLVSHLSLPQARVGVEVKVSTSRLAGGTVPVILRPVLGESATLTAGVQPVTVRLWVETAPEGGRVPAQATEPVEVEVRPDVEELRPAVYLKEGLGFAAGQALILRADDSETGESLAKVPLTLLVDWE